MQLKWLLWPLYFGARMSHQSVGTNGLNLRDMYEMTGISVRYPPNGVLERLSNIFVMTVVRATVANFPALDKNATNYHLWRPGCRVHTSSTRSG
ncbi:hypothetical protein EMIT0P100_240079 [Pseudomonas sp. IT-P100]